MRTSANNAATLYHIPFYKAKGLDELDQTKIYIFPLKVNSVISHQVTASNPFSLGW